MILAFHITLTENNKSILWKVKKNHKTNDFI